MDPRFIPSGCPSRLETDYSLTALSSRCRPGGAAGIIPTANGQRPDSIDISAYVNIACDSVIHILWLRIVFRIPTDETFSNFSKPDGSREYVNKSDTEFIWKWRAL